MSSERDRRRVLVALPREAEPDPGVLPFGDLLRHFRRAADLTQEQLAERAGLSVAGISALERGAKVSPQRETVRLLAEALALSPEDRQRLEATVAVRRPSNVGKAPSPRPPGFVPMQTGTLVGREREQAELAALLADPTCRLLTLVGPGGIGKTRLATQVVVDGDGRFADGVAFVSLAPVRSIDRLVSALIDALALSLHGQHDPQAQLLDALRDREVLLVLDNFEQVLGGAALVATLLRHAPRVKALVTSQERLNVREEWVYAVEGLGVPPDGTDADIERYGAVRLFVHRARAAQSRFTLQPQDRPHVARICQVVGGMPLGIELAAAWVPVLSCAEIAQEIARSFDFLATAPRDVPERHRNMRAVFDYSWQLLSEQQRQSFRALTVFRGGFQRSAAVAVAGASLFTLSALVGKSFLRRTSSDRFEIHELLRQYGEGQLDADPDEAWRVRDRHSTYYLEFLAQREGQLRGGEQQAALNAIDAELVNVQAAWDRAIEEGNAALLARAMEGLWLYYAGRGRAWEGEAAFAAAAAALDAPASTVGPGDATREIALGMVLTRLASSQFRLGAYAQARALLERGVALFRRLDVPRELGFALNLLAATVHLYGDVSEERRLLQESIALLQTAGDQWCAAYSRNDLALATDLVRDADGAQRLAQESLAFFEAFGDRRGVAFASNNLGEIAAQRGDYAEAERFHRQSLVLRRAGGDRWGIAYSLNQLGRVARLAGTPDEARTWLLEALRMAHESRALPIVLEVLTELATLHAAAGDADRALDLLYPVLRHPARTRRTDDTTARLLAGLEARRCSPGAVSVSGTAATVEEIVAALLAETPVALRG